MTTNKNNTTARPVSPPIEGRKGGVSYFTIEELTASATALREGIDNRPPESAYHLLHVLVRQLLDPIRRAWGEAICVTSGYRCPELNALVGGTTHSHHMLGCAADLSVCSAGANRRLHALIVQMKEEGRIRFTQLILEEGGRWIHVSYVPGDLRCQVIG